MLRKEMGDGARFMMVTDVRNRLSFITWHTYDLGAKEWKLRGVAVSDLRNSRHLPKLLLSQVMLARMEHPEYFPDAAS